jgi:hypothetical protein
VATVGRRIFLLLFLACGAIAFHGERCARACRARRAAAATVCRRTADAGLDVWRRDGVRAVVAVTPLAAALGLLLSR